MTPTMFGWIGAGLIVAIASALVIRRRPVPRYGHQQGYSVAATILIFASAVLSLVAAVVVLLSVDVRDGKMWVGSIACAGLGLGLLAASYYYLRFSVVVTPDSVTYTDPFRGTHTIAKKNLVSVESTRFKGAAQSRFVLMDEGKQRSVTLSHRIVDLNALFYRTEDDAFAEARRYVDTFASQRDRYSVDEGFRSDGIAIERVHGRYVVTNDEKGQRYTEFWFPDRTEALAYFIRLFEADEGLARGSHSVA